MKQLLMALAVSAALLGTAAPVLAESDIQSVKRKLIERLPGATVDHIAPTPMKGVY